MTAAGSSPRSLRSTGTATAAGAISATIADSTPSGPSSRNVRLPSSAMAVTPSANRTVSRTCRTQ